MSGGDSTPIDVFLELWHSASTWRANIVLSAKRPTVKFSDDVKEALLIEDGVKSALAIRKILAIYNDAYYKGAVLLLLQEIDAFVYCMHPRALIHPSVRLFDISFSHWLRKIKKMRVCDGYYATDARGFKVVPRGPLARLPRHEYATSAVCFSDRFSSLSVVPIAFKIDNVPVSVKHVVKSLNVAEGVGPGAGSGEEIITFIPVAEKSDDLIAKQREDNGNLFVDFDVVSTLDVPQTIVNALSQVGYTDIAIAPELVVSELDADRLVELMMGNPGNCRFILSGTGNTVAQEAGQSWNEARVINGAGAEIWRQTKLWQAGLCQKRALSFNLKDPSERLVMEDNCPGDEVVIADIDGFGRCVILICQDVQSRPMTDELIRVYQPDWVFTPILDTGIIDGRWVHARVFELSAIAQARFVVASSTSLAEKVGLENVACGLAVGPKDGTTFDAGRVCELAYSDSKVTPGFAVVKWREDWGCSELSQKKKKR